ncbi:MAG: FAD-dependent oxidoreductase [Rhodobiaceae bacterium]|nr:FAD-dependent oxidoreductase [Rhodobiaceae bacterium]
MPRYAYKSYPYTKPPELTGGKVSDAPVVIVGAGPVGLAAAIDLAQHGIASVVLDDNDVVSVGSRAICWAKRTLEIFDRLGVGERMVEKGVTWKVGRLFHGDREVYAFDLLPEPGHKNPAFINLQQYYVEEYLVDRCADFPDLIDLRWKNRVIAVRQSGNTVVTFVDTSDGTYTIEAAYLLACDGAKSSVREMLGLEFAGRVFEERFLITDVEMKADFPSERWFWFEPQFHNGQSALLHKQPDDIYRIDLQLGWNADPEEERKPENVIPRIRAIVGDREFEIDWVSVYTFQCRRLERFVHDRVIFAGDSAHVVSPFGARGGNGGIQDTDNLCWKLAMVLKGQANQRLIETYDEERTVGADENILNSTRATRFMTPADGAERLFRDETLALAETMPFARRLINSGRLSLPCSLAGMSLAIPDSENVPGGLVPGAPCVDAPVLGNGKPAWLLDRLGGAFQQMTVSQDAITLANVAPDGSLGEMRSLACDTNNTAPNRYAPDTPVTYLVRPDQHIAARSNAATQQWRIIAMQHILGGAA